jgi:NTP pyrophosphatase (non-canonical NTP hydrolase)
MPKKDQFEVLKDIITRFLEDRDWIKYHTPKNLSMSLAIEVAELMELFQWDDKTAKEVIENDVLKKQVEAELADIMIYALSLARTLQIDVLSCIQEKMSKNNERFPARSTKKSI